ncbi:flagellar basal body rod protein FlgB [Ferroacidibacillus organovorans]|uniref:flagellar basal body rod protein FlgB n=1 Tax=Ferroacidibacillus organovorans TaxID=1765683 RepID=UPI000A420AB8|nr:flagellar basal body rod protein FlgB [Ferroacidibacillus organovorans]
MSGSFTIAALQSALDAAQLRQQVYANNIANANTPGYHRETVQFNTLLLQAIAQANGSGTLSMLQNSPSDLSASQTLQNVTPVVTVDQNTAVSSNGNNVNLDAEMSGLAMNQIDTAAMVTELNDQFALLRTAILGS